MGIAEWLKKKGKFSEMREHEWEKKILVGI